MYNLSCYNWHPLYKHVRQVHKDYFVYVNENYQKGYINFEECQSLVNKVDFKFWLKYCIDFHMARNEDYSLAKIFEPLFINQYEDLVLFKYDSYAKLAEKGYDFLTFFELYDGLYLECRSVVINIRQMTIVLAPQAKFKNLNEDNTWSMEHVLDIMAESNNNYIITNKMDGSNQNYCYNSSDHRIYCSGSQALNPEESWRLEKGLVLFQANIGYERLLREFPDTTFMFEFCSPDNPIVVKYDKEQEGLYLFGARDNLTGREISPIVLQSYAEKYHVPMVDIYYNKSLQDILEETKNYTCDEKEGWVISIFNESNSANKNVFKVKLKVDDYILMHRVVTSLASPNLVIEIVSDGNFDDFYSRVPEAYKSIIGDFYSTIQCYKVNMEKLILLEYCKCMDITNQNQIERQESGNIKRKRFMIATEEICSKETIGYVRDMYLKMNIQKEQDYELHVLHNGRGIDKGRSYKKIGEMQEWIQKNKDKYWWIITTTLL